ncbi:MAG TPA: endonuclease VII domain-containing protein [Acidimicrobiales bacterium]|nr:endonuclease VII domain-containing protein [Acidimicrobiales bacterium]
MSSKACRTCGETKPLGEFYRDRAARDGHRPECKACTAARRKAWYAAHREAEITRVKQWQQQNPGRVNENRRRKQARRDAYYRRTYGISADDVDALLDREGGGCAVCGRRPARAASLHLDRCHDTGAVRGILCLSCNQGVGKFRDDPDLLEAAARYLRGRRGGDGPASR